MVNIFLSSFVWAHPRPGSGTRHHVLDLYSRVFCQKGCKVYPTRPDENLVFAALIHLSKFKSGTLNVVTQGYPIIAAFIALLLFRRVHLIVHTWKVPGYTDSRLSARLYDVALDFVIRHAAIVVVASTQQYRQVAEKYPTIPVFFAPVTVDCAYWSPDRDLQRDPAILSHFQLEQDRYVLTVGGKDRDERLGLLLARELGIRYVRATYEKAVVDQVHAVINELGAADTVAVLYSVTDDELRALYRNAFALCLPTTTKTNPAGLSALVESLASGAVAIIFDELANGYVTAQHDGVVTNASTDVSTCASVLRKLDRIHVRESARVKAMTDLNGCRVAGELAAKLRSIGQIRHFLSE